MNSVLRWGGASLVLAVAACSSPPPPPPPAAPPPPALSEQDRTFINQATLSGQAEVQEGQLAAAKGARPAVKQFGEQMVTDHTPVNQQLAQLAQSKGVTPPAELDPAHAAILARLQRERGYTFDRDYMRNQVADHHAAVALFQRESTEGTDADLKSFAAQTLPTLESHLAEAQKLVAPTGSPHHTTKKKPVHHS